MLKRLRILFGATYQPCLYKNYTFCFCECRTLPVLQAFEQCVERSFCLWNIPDCEALRKSCDIRNPYVLYESQVSFPQFPDMDFLYQNAFANTYMWLWAFRYMREGLLI